MTYGLEASPPFYMLIVLAVQHVLVIIVDLSLPVLVVTAVCGSPAQTTWMVQMSMVAIAMGMLLQIQKKGIGTGYLIPHSTTSIYMAPSLLAAQSGGLAMVAGMTLIAGGFQMVLAKFAQRLGKLLPVHLPGVILAINGCVLVHAAVPRLLGAGGISGQIDWCTTGVGCATVAGIVAMYLCGAVVLRIYGLAIGILCGYLISLVLGVDSAGIDTAIHSAPLFALPKWQHPGFDFDAVLICPFLIAAVAVSIKGSGLISQGHQINGVYRAEDRKQRMSAGLLADGTGTFLSGLLGGFGSSMSAANLGLSAASRATSRRIGYGVAIILLLLVCFPKLTAALYFMPQPVMGAAMFCIGAHLIGVGVELIRTTPLGLRSILTVGFPLLVGLWIEVMPPAFPAASGWTDTLVTSSISATALLAFGCHYLIFSLHRYHHRPGSTG